MLDGDEEMIDTKRQPKSGPPKEGHQVQKGEFMLSPNCLHPLGGRCLNCIGTAKEESKDESPKKPRCAHGPGTTCVHCLGVDENNFDQISYTCNHDASARCPNCTKNEATIKDAKH